MLMDPIFHLVTTYKNPTGSLFHRTIVIIEMEYTRRFSPLINAEGFQEGIPLVLAHDCAECPPDVVPGRVLWWWSR